MNEKISDLSQLFFFSFDFLLIYKKKKMFCAGFLCSLRCRCRTIRVAKQLSAYDSRLAIFYGECHQHGVCPGLWLIRPGSNTFPYFFGIFFLLTGSVYWSHLH